MIVIEQTQHGYSAYSPELSGRVSTSANRAAVEKNMHEAIAFHLDGLREEGLPGSETRTYSAYVEPPA